MRNSIITCCFLLIALPLFCDTLADSVWYKADGTATLSFVDDGSPLPQIVFQTPLYGQFTWLTGKISTREKNTLNGILNTVSSRIIVNRHQEAGVLTLDVQIDSADETVHRFAGTYQNTPPSINTRVRKSFVAPYNESLSFLTDEEKRLFLPLFTKYRAYLKPFWHFVILQHSSESQQLYAFLTHKNDTKPHSLLLFEDDRLFFIFYDHRPEEYPEIRFLSNRQEMPVPIVFYHYITIHDDAVLMRR